jgi:hypothetical protein
VEDAAGVRLKRISLFQIGTAGWSDERVIAFDIETADGQRRIKLA